MHMLYAAAATFWGVTATLIIIIIVLLLTTIVAITLVIYRIKKYPKGTCMHDHATSLKLTLHDAFLFGL